MLEFKRKKRAPALVLSYNNAAFATSSIAIAPNLKALVVGCKKRRGLLSSIECQLRPPPTFLYIFSHT
ncbi:hypothetical protein LguiA_010487 [Lonicera macranthoides]